MIATSWNCFHWKLTSLPPAPMLKEPFLLRRARPDEKEAAYNVALFALKMNTSWHEASDEVAKCIQKAANQSFREGQEPSCFIITHGMRSIGVSMIDPRKEAECHLLSGPWVLAEYRNRGFGTALLHASLCELLNQGVVDAFGLTRNNGVTAKFVYPKFGGVISDSVRSIGADKKVANKNNPKDDLES